MGPPIRKQAGHQKDSGMITVGVDPGLTGAIAAINGEDLCWVEDMPTIDGEIAIPVLNRLYSVDEYGPWQLTHDMPVAIEYVHSMPGQGVSSTFKFGKAYGAMLGYFGARHRITRTAPTEWKTTFRLNGKDKDAARLLAIELWPNSAETFRRKKDGGRADAALIALHHSRQLRHLPNVAEHHRRMQELRDAPRQPLTKVVG